MPTLTNAGEFPDNRLPPAPADEHSRSGLRRRISLVVGLAVMAWAAVELVGLSLNHTVGPELYGVLVAALAVGAGGLTTLVLASDKQRPWLAVLALVLWAVVAIGGLGGTVAHIVGPGTGHGPIDQRERPVVAPLVFTAIGLVGGAVLVYGNRFGIRRLLDRWKG